MSTIKDVLGKSTGRRLLEKIHKYFQNILFQRLLCYYVDPAQTVDRKPPSLRITIVVHLIYWFRWYFSSKKEIIYRGVVKKKCFYLTKKEEYLKSTRFLTYVLLYQSCLRTILYTGTNVYNYVLDITIEDTVHKRKNH